MKRQFLNINTNSKYQSGMSMVELMISMVVGLFLLAGVVTNFLSTSSADLKRESVAEMDQNAAQAFDVMRKIISHAGYPSIENTPMEEPFYTDNEDIDEDFYSATTTCGDGSDRDSFNIQAGRRTRDLNVRDFIMVASLADNPCINGVVSCEGAANPNINPKAHVFTDCLGGGATRDARTVACSTDPSLGMPDPRDAKIYSAVWVQRNVISPNDRVLFCEGSRTGSRSIINNVEAIQYRYGVRDDNERTNYRTANQVSAADQWPMVTSVQVAMLLRSDHQYVLDKPSTKIRYNLLNRNVDIAVDDRRRLFRVYTTSINLENRKFNQMQ